MLTAAVISALFAQCAPDVSPSTMSALMAVESSGKPYGVANVTDDTSHFFDTEKEAIEFTDKLNEQGKKYSAGLMQIYVNNFKHYGVTNKTIFNHCKNIEVGADILRGCYVKAKKEEDDDQAALRKAFSCYYSGNFMRGFKEEAGGTSYVQRVESKVKGKPSNYSVPEILIGKVNGKSEPKKIKGGEAVVSIDNDSDVWDVFGDY